MDANILRQDHRLSTPGRSCAVADYCTLHRGETLIVCGCGPSLHELNDPKRWITIGVNDVGRLFDPTYLME